MDTINNLTKAFIGESQARNRYTFYAKIAKKEGLEQLSDIFLKTADNEREHAKWLLRLINQLKENSEDIIVEASAVTTMGSTIENLKSAIKGEHFENSEMYPGFADVAEKEGLSEIAQRLRAIGSVEAHHEERYIKLLKELENNSLFKKENKVYWICRVCGYVYEGNEPPKACPSCGHPSNYFEILSEEY